MNEPVLSSLIWGGAAVTVAGLLLLVLCILRVIKAKNAGASDDAMADVLRRVAPMNLGGLCLSALGLMCVVIGLVLS